MLLDGFMPLQTEVARPRDNSVTVDYLRKIAKKEGLDLQATLLDYRRCSFASLHNKGMIVDGEVTLVGSLNWGESALKFNREAGLLVRDTTIAGYYTKTFQYDWKCSSER
jgi:phosphatidylserine/phosphatidylglycerophosphate/cardiolipin synthase-like enzyme